MEQYSSCNFTAPQRKNIDDVDHISQLPDAILSHIFTLLNVKEAFRTRLLSHRWRYLCVHMSNLVFDFSFMTGLEDEQSFDFSKLSPFEHKFVEQVDQFLNMITIQKPLTLKVCFPLGQEFASHIDDWINFATRMECVKLELDFDHGMSTDYGNSSGPYNFPCHLLLSGERSQLKYLSLCECICHPPLEAAQRLDSLEYLILDNVFVEYLSFDDINDYTPTSSNLTKLHVTIKGDCGLNLFTYMLYKSPWLQILVINKGYTPPINGELEWAYPQLVPTCLSSCLKEVYFEQFNGQDGELEFVGYILKNASVLEEMTITITVSSIETMDQIVNKIQAFPRSSKTSQILLRRLNFADPHPVQD